MTIQDLGNIGEFVAAIAVVISVIYLAIQIRQNTGQMRTQAWGDSFEAYSQFRKMVIAHPELTRLRSLPANDLNYEEKHCLELLIEELCWCSNQLFIAYNKGLLGEHTWEGATERLIEYLQNEHLESCWQRWKFMYDEGFVQVIDLRLEKGA